MRNLRLIGYALLLLAAAVLIVFAVWKDSFAALAMYAAMALVDYFRKGG